MGELMAEDRVRWTWVDSGVCALLVALTALIHFPLLDLPVGGMDEGLLLVYPRLMSQGWVMHRDFQTGYGPGFFWFLQGWVGLFGESILQMRVLAVGVRAVAAVLVYLMIRRTSHAAGMGLGLACLISVTIMPPRAPTWFSAATLLLAWVWLVTREGRSDGRTLGRGFVAGVVAAGAMAVRLDTVALAVVVGTPVVLALLGRRGFGAYVVGGVVGLVPFGVHVGVAGARAVYENMYVDPMLTAAGRVLPLPPAGGDDLKRFWILLGVVGVSVLAGVWGLVVRGRLDSHGLEAHATGDLGAGGSGPRDGTARERRRGGRRGWGAVLAGVVSVCLLPYVLQRADRNHLAIGLAVLIPLAGAGVVWSWGRWRGVGVAVALVAPAVALGAMWGDYFGWWSQSYPQLAFGTPRAEVVAHDGVSARVAPAQAEAYRELFATVDGISRARTIYVAPANLLCTPYNDLQVYFLFPKLKPAGYLFEMNPGFTNRAGSRLAGDIAAADVLVLGTAYDHWNEPNASTRPGSGEAGEVVGREFRLVRDLGLFRVYVNRRMGGR